ncbi:MAG TPA: PQQ-dependent sugar dehydrogenase [Burkholderiaceae bacterium]|nr:PQQ-dependent sugar dehydrogenase [Burkholderiaceae bacterium]
MRVVLTRLCRAIVLVALCPASAFAADPLKPVTVAQGLVNPWSLAFLPDGRMLVTERPGRLRIVDKGGALGAPIAGLPAISVGGQCGLLDVALDPRFADNGVIYFSYAEPATAPDSGNSTAVARATLAGNTLADVRTIFVQKPKVSSSAHCGGRLVFARDGRLFVTLGERFSRKDDAQTLDNHLGKIVRIEADGRVPADNPFVGRAGALPEIWSLGHRNVQGAAIHPATGELWESEHGPQGGDEINVIDAGKNYGWPLITFGRNYVIGTRIGEEGPKPGFEQPLKTWVPTSIAPSGMAFLTSDRYPGWQGSLFIGALRGEALVRLTIDGRKVVGEQRLLEDLKERIRDVRQGPDGWLYLLTDSPSGRILRIER